MSKPLVLAMRLSIVTGQRIGSILGMEHTDLDLSGQNPVWSIPGSRTKNGDLNRVPLTNLALDLIHQALALSTGQLWVFPSPQGEDLSALKQQRAP